MTAIATEIKNIIISHLWRKLFGMEVYDQHELPLKDSLMRYCFVILLALLVSACGAPAATLPTALPLPTAIPLADVDLNSILAPLPTDADGPIDTTDGMFAGLPRPTNEAGIGFASGFVAVFLYDSPVAQGTSYALLESGLRDGKDERTLGEKSWLSTMVTNASGKVRGDVVFQRCEAVAYVRGLSLKDVETLLTYAHDLDKRLQDAVC